MDACPGAHPLRECPSARGHQKNDEPRFIIVSNGFWRNESWPLDVHIWIVQLGRRDRVLRALKNGHRRPDFQWSESHGHSTVHDTATMGDGVD